MPKPPLLGEVAKPSGFDGEVLPQAAAAGVKPLSHGLRRDSSPSRGAFGKRFIFRFLRLSAPKPASAAGPNTTPATSKVAKR